MELRRETNLDVSDSFRQTIFGELIRDALERLLVSQHRTGVGETSEILVQVVVSILEDKLAQALRTFRGQLDSALLGELDQGLEAQRPVEMDVQVRFGEALEQLARERSRGRQSWGPRLYSSVMPRRSSYVVTFVGRDRPGLVETVAAIVARHGANWEESRMTRMAGEFAGILSVSVPGGNAAALVSDLEGLRKEGLDLVIKESTAERSAAGPTVKLEIFGPDRPGIVEEAFRALAERGVNVEELHTECISAPMTGQPLFRATAMLLLPADRTLAQLRADLDSLADELALDLSVEEPAD